MKRWLPCMLAFLMAAAASNPARMSTAAKIDAIEKGRVEAGSRLVFPESDLNLYLSQKVKEVAPEGVKNPRVTIGAGQATGRAVVDFVKLKRAQGVEMSWMMRKLLEGEHDLLVTGRLSSGAGKGRVDIDQVDIGGMEIKGRALALLIRMFVAPHYPTARVGETFELGYDMDRIELAPGAATVVMASKAAPWRRVAPVRRSALVPALPPARAQ